MTNESLPHDVIEQKHINFDESLQLSPPAEPKNIFGERLRVAREALGLERMDVAAQLRLHEKFILMMEKGDFSASDLPVMFIRGYLRNYSKFLQIPEDEVKKALEPIVQKPKTSAFKPQSQVTQQPEAAINKYFDKFIQALQYCLKRAESIKSSDYFMQAITYLIMLTMTGLVGTWWYTHTAFTPLMAPEKQLLPFRIHNKSAASANVITPIPAVVNASPMIGTVKNLITNPKPVANAAANTSQHASAPTTTTALTSANNAVTSPVVTKHKWVKHRKHQPVYYDDDDDDEDSED